ncbi:amino acid permease [Thermoanaerobacterium sp. RBIITD]|uniref:amino acid permease n=1 Tax=Thermoanaerobacterium sp. RBIITD TaxID=1550240 RepID=UPI001E4759EB|nr:amino acid permease [Thermoanaerobacterium sp. RBIITD]
MRLAHYAVTLFNISGAKVPWLIFAILCELIIWFIAFTDIKLSSNIMLLVEGISIILVIGISLVILREISFTKSLNFIPFSVSENGKNFLNYGTGIVYAILCFGGFEAASNFGEESKNPIFWQEKDLDMAADFSSHCMYGIYFLILFQHLSGSNLPDGPSSLCCNCMDSYRCHYYHFQQEPIGRNKHQQQSRKSVEI